MKTLLALTAFAALAVPAAASAQAAALGPVTGNVAITGKVDARCVIAPTASIALNEMADANGVYNLAADGKTATLNGWCNGLTSTMTVASTAITRTGAVGAAPTGFVDVVNFVATASVTPAGAAAAVSASDSTLAAPSAAASVGLFSGNVTVALSGSSTPVVGKLVAGNYTGAVAVTLTPGL